MVGRERMMDGDYVHPNHYQLGGDDILLFRFYIYWCYLHEEDADDESGSLAVAHLTIMQRVGFHDVEEAFLA